MNKSKDEYVLLINNSEYFTLEDGDRKKDIEKKKLEANVFFYTKLLGFKNFNSYNEGECELEVYTTIMDCIKGYVTNDNATFLTYYITSIRKTMAKVNGKIESNRYGCGIKKPVKHIKVMKAIRHYAKKMDYVYDDKPQALINKVVYVYNSNAEKSNLKTKVTFEEVCNIIDKDLSMTYASNVCYHGDAEEESIFNFIALDGGVDACNVQTDNESVVEQLKNIEEIFNGFQERVKIKNRDIITSILLKGGMARVVNKDSLKSVSYINLKHLDEFLKTGKVYTQNEIAELHNVTKEDISRAKSKFLDKLSQKLKK